MPPEPLGDVKRITYAWVQLDQGGVLKLYPGGRYEVQIEGKEVRFTKEHLDKLKRLEKEM